MCFLGIFFFYYSREQKTVLKNSVKQTLNLCFILLHNVFNLFILPFRDFSFPLYFNGFWIFLINFKINFESHKCLFIFQSKIPFKASFDPFWILFSNLVIKPIFKPSLVEFQETFNGQFHDPRSSLLP